MQENPNQTATVDLKELFDDVKSREFRQIIKIQDTEQEDKLEEHLYRELSSLVTTSYIPSLAYFNNIQTELDQVLEMGDLNEIRRMQESFKDLREMCFDDLCTWCKYNSDKDVYNVLRQSENQTWDERIKTYKDPKVKRINSAFNENLIVPIMELANKYVEVLQQVNDLAKLKDGILSLKKSYDSEVDKLKQDQEYQTKKDLDRDGIVIRNTFAQRGTQRTKYHRVKGAEFVENGLKETLQDNLKRFGLSQAQIDFIACHSNQSGLTGAGYPVMPMPHVCSNLVIDVQQRPGGQTPKVSLISLGYNTVRDLDDPEKKPEYLGMGYISIDISSLGDKEKKYVPGVYENVELNFSSDFFYNDHAKAINGIDTGIPSKLLHKTDAKEFERNYKDFGENYLRILDNKKALLNMNAIKDSPESVQHYMTAKLFSDKACDKDFYSQLLTQPYVTADWLNEYVYKVIDAKDNLIDLAPEIQQNYISSRLFNSDHTVNNDFYQYICFSPNIANYVDKKIVDKAISDGVVTNVSKLISSELERINNDQDNHKLDNEDRKGITNRIYDSVSPLIPGGAENVVKQTISKLVLDVAYSKNAEITLGQKVEVWWNKVVDLITFKSKHERLSQHITSSRQNNATPRSRSASSSNSRSF